MGVGNFFFRIYYSMPYSDKTIVSVSYMLFGGMLVQGMLFFS